MPPVSSGRTIMGDLDEMLPTNHGFDQFYGNLYHLNAEEEPGERGLTRSIVVLPDGSTFLEKYGPRGVIRSTGRLWGRQHHPGDRGHRTPHQKAHGDRRRRYVRQRHCFHSRAAEAGNPWFVWWNGTRMHFRTHVKDELRGISGQDEYSDGMVEHDMHVGKFSTCSTNSASRTIPLSSIRPTTGRT